MSDVITVGEDRKKSDEVSLGPAASLEERNRVLLMVTEWIAGYKKKGVTPPENLSTSLAFLPPNEAVLVFRDSNWQPSPKDLVLGGGSFLQSDKREVSQWLLCAAAVHPDCKEIDYDAIASVSRVSWVSKEAWYRDILGFASSRFPERLQYSVFVARSLLDDESFDDALAFALENMRIRSIDDIKSRRPVATEELSREFLSLFMVATDCLGRLERPNDELALCKWVFHLSMGLPSRMLRNVGRALRRFSRDTDQEGRLLMEAAVLLDREEEQALKWLESDWDFSDGPNSEERILIRLSLVARDPSDAEYWAAVGALYHDGRQNARATRWLEAAVALAPDDSRYREALVINLQSLGRLADGRRLAHGSEVPDVVSEDLLEEARSGHRQLLALYWSRALEVFDDRPLIDRSAPPAWLIEEGVGSNPA